MIPPALTPLDDAWWTEERSSKVAAMVGYGMPVEMIAGYLEVDPAHLIGPRWEVAVSRGEVLAEAAVAQGVYNQAKEGKPAAVRMWRDGRRAHPYNQQQGKDAKKAAGTAKKGGPPPAGAAPKPEPPAKPASVGPAIARLTEQRRRFVHAYVLNGGNGAEAAREAGYSEKTARSQAHRLLTNVDIQESIAAEAHRLAAKVEATEDRIVEELGYVAFSNILHFCRIGDDGHPILDLATLPDGASRAIQEITTETRSYYRGDVEHTVRKSKLKLASKNQALDLLGRWRKMFVQQHEHAGPGGGPIPVEERHENLLDKIGEKLEEIRRQRQEGKQAIAEVPLPGTPDPSGPAGGSGQ